MIKKIVLFIFFTISFTCFSKEKIGKNIKLGTDLYLNINSEDIFSDLYTIGGKLKFDYTPTENTKFQLKVKFEPDQFELNRIYGAITLGNAYFRLGFDKTEILVEDKLNSVEYPFPQESGLTQYLTQLGWYPKSNIGFKYKQKGISDTLNFKSFLQFNPQMTNVQGFFNLEDHLNKSIVGLSFSQLLSTTQEYDTPFFYLLNLYIADIDIDNKWNYKVDMSFGNNTNPPVEYNHYPNYSPTDKTNYWAIDSYISKNIFKVNSDFVISPSFGLTYIMPDIHLPQYSNSEYRLGCRLAKSEMFYLLLEGGIRLNIYNDKNITFGIEELWALSTHFRY